MFPKMQKNTILSYFEIIHILILLVIISVIFHYYNMAPMSEDAAYYAFVSNHIANGYVLFNDVLVSGNSIFFYITAAVFKIFGANIWTYRYFHESIFFFLCVIISLIARKSISKPYWLLCIYIWIFVIAAPLLNWDFGRNYIYASLACLMLSVLFKIFKNPFWFGVFIGLSCCIRETFVIFLACYLILVVINKGFGKINKLNDHDVYDYCLKEYLGIVVALTVYFLPLVFYQNFSSYYQYTFVSAVKLRHSNTLIHTVLNNLLAVKYSTINQFLFIYISAITALFFKSENQLINLIKVWLLPASIIEAFIINQTNPYTLIPLITFCVILSVDLFSRISWHSKKWRMLRVLFALLFILQIYNIFTEYKDWFKYSNSADGNINNYKSNEHTNRMLHAVDGLQFSKVATNSQWVFLFRANVKIASKVYYEDLSAPYNTGRIDMAAKQIEAIKEQVPDLCVLKSSDSTIITSETPLQKAIFSNYINVANFGRSSNLPFSTPLNSLDDLRYRGLYSGYTINQYVDMVLYAKRIINNLKVINQESYSLKTNLFYKEIVYQGVRPVIIKVEFAPDYAIRGAVISCGHSKVYYNEHYDNKRLYTIVHPGETINISCKTMNRDEIFYVKIDYLSLD